MEVVLASASEKQVWTTKYLKEYVRESALLPYMGTAPESIIRIRSELSEGGKYLNIPLITRLRGRGVRGAEVLKGNEDDLGNFNDQVLVDWIRNAPGMPNCCATTRSTPSIRSSSPAPPTSTVSPARTAPSSTIRPPLPSATPSWSTTPIASCSES